MSLEQLLELALKAEMPQAAHAAAALLALYLGARAEPRDRLVLWSACAVMFAGLGWLGFRFGLPGLPTSYRAFAPEPYLFAPIPGALELRGIDHAVHMLLGAVFAVAATVSLVHAWRAARAEPRVRYRSI